MESAGGEGVSHGGIESIIKGRFETGAAVFERAVCVLPGVCENLSSGGWFGLSGAVPAVWEAGEICGWCGRHHGADFCGKLNDLFKEVFMSTAAQSAPQQATQSTTVTPANQSSGYSTSGYSVGRALGKCSVCQGAIAPGDKFYAAVRETAVGLERLDISGRCWETFEKSTLLAFWQATMPAATAAKPKLFVDDSVLCDLFERLSDAAEAAKINFRFVLGLILMRKRLLVYESSHLESGREFWSVRIKGREQIIDVVNPKLSEEQVGEVSGQLGQILSGEMA
jgi:hypothetical protein